MRVIRKAILLGAASSALGAPASAALGQSLLDRSDNVSGDWVGNTGTVYFNFIHRFSRSAAPERKVSNFPTFLIATGIGARGLVGVNYATNSLLTPRYPNEWELFARYAPLQQEEGAALDVGGQVDYNAAVQGIDGELSLARREGPVRLIAVVRALADTIRDGKTRLAFGGGSTVRLNRFIALAGDAATIASRGDGERVAWSAGVHIALPNTPHTLSVHVSNANTATLQGLTRGAETKRYGFEFTVPVTLSRFLGNPGDSPAPATPETPPIRAAAPMAEPAAPARPTAIAADSTVPRPAPASAPAATAVAPPPRQPPVAAPAQSPARQPAAERASSPRRVNARMKGSAFLPNRLEITPGSTVSWKNLDQMIHTVAAADKSFSSPIVGSDGSYSHTFEKPGTYAIYCTVHPFMKATVVVK